MADRIERIFSASSSGNSDVTLGELPDFTDDDDYNAAIARVIREADAYSNDILLPERDEENAYYYGELPGLEDPDALEPGMGDPDDAEPANRNAIVSTDVRDTIMAMVPSLMRIFGGSEHAVNFLPRYNGQDQMAKDATNYIRWKFWEDNNGFMNLHAVICDALKHRMGVMTWWTEEEEITKVVNLDGIRPQELVAATMQYGDEFEVVETRPSRDGTLSVTLAIKDTQRSTKVEAVPLDEFRVSPDARTVDTADLIGRDTYVRASYLISQGYDPDVVLANVGATRPINNYTFGRPFDEVSNRSNAFHDLVRFGRYYVRIDRDGDGVAELRYICVVGDNFEIVEDYPANAANYAVFSADPTPHTLLGDSYSSLVKDIQNINTGLVRGALDSLAHSINPRTAINETLTNVNDALNEDLGAIIRTRANPADAVYPIIIPFVGADAFTMKQQIDALRQSRTGISEASKGVDPKALQSTTLAGVDLIASGAQERIELVAMFLAHSGLAPMYRGLLREVVEHPNQQEQLEVSGKMLEMSPGNFDPNLRIKVNPALGKGSDMTRLMALNDIKATQISIITQFGVNNPVVGVEEFRNTIVDILAIANIQTPSRYFKEITPEIAQAIASTPKEPDPATLLAQAELEKVKAGVIQTKADITAKERKSILDDDFRRDKMNVDLMVDLVGILAEFATADVPEDTLAQGEALNSPV